MLNKLSNFCHEGLWLIAIILFGIGCYYNHTGEYMRTVVCTLQAIFGIILYGIRR